MVPSTLDPQTLEAIGVLSRAIERVRVPGVVEFRLLVNALGRAIESRSEDELGEAARVFRSLEPEIRSRIVEQAKAEAHAQARRSEAVTLEPPTQPPASAPTTRTPRSIGASFLAALNGMKPAAARTGNRDAAKDRLKAAVDSQRALPDDGPDVGYDRGLRPGARLPRAS
ncbi:hypothetical protein [Azospirillum doebereinerae]|uniref:hypothetical protein n=1 Tax=Azospirillum doebereinerae TaxID=92933 RepID=UPI00163C5041|nr:hypothetical protein [Azospirillum doebereinerae]